MSEVKYKRVIMKLSGEALAGDKGTGINPPVIQKVAEELRDVHDLGVQIAMVVGTCGVEKLVNSLEWNVFKLTILVC